VSGAKPWGKQDNQGTGRGKVLKRKIKNTVGKGRELRRKPVNRSSGVLGQKVGHKKVGVTQQFKPLGIRTPPARGAGPRGPSVLARTLR